MKIITSILTVFLFLTGTAAQTCFAGRDTDFDAPSAPAGLCVSYRTSTSITLSWEASRDNNAVKGYQVFRDGRKIATVSKTSYTNANLIPGQSYTYGIKAYDASGNISESSITIKVSTIPDLQPPSAPSGLSVTAADYTSVTLDWEPSSDNIGIKSYEVYRNGKKAGTTSKTVYTCKGLKPGERYDFTVRAIDAAGNSSVFSNCTAGAARPDKTAPSVPGALSAEAVTETEISLCWSPSTDNVRVKNYEITCEGLKPVKSSDTRHTFKKLVPGKSYTFKVSACDTSGNVSAAGKPFTVSTAADNKAPSAPGNLTAKTKGGRSVALSWEASSDNVKVQKYYIYRNGINIESTSRRSLTVKNPSGAGIWIYSVRACDLSGNLSPSSRLVTVVSLK